MEFLDNLRPLIDWLHLNPGWAGFVTFLISLSESLAIVGLLVPGSVIMTAIGTLIGAGVIPSWQIILWAIAGAIAGDSFSYHIGYHFNERLRSFWPFTRYPNLIAKGEEFFHQHGGKSVFLGRFVGPMRPIVPMVAGMMKMRPRKFIISNVLSGIIWAPSYMVPGMLIGAASLELDPKTATRFIMLVLAVLLVIWLTTWLFKRLLTWLYVRAYKILQNIWDQLREKNSLQGFCNFITDPEYPDSPQQLTLVLLFLTGVVCFSALTIFVHVFDGFSNFNTEIHNYFQSLYSPFLTNIFIYITILGYRTVIIPATCVGIGYLMLRRNWRNALAWLGVMVLSALVIGFFKQFIDSPRPGGFAGGLYNNSYPSGHTTLSVTIYGFFAVLVSRHLSTMTRHFYYGLAATVCSLIIFSRLYLGQHWVTDVAAGTIVALSNIFLFSMLLRSKKPEKLAVKSFIAVFFVALAICWSWHLTFRYQHYVKRYTHIPNIASIHFNEWWNNSSVMLRTNRMGKPVQLFNLQWAGDIENIEAKLAAEGWKPLPKLTLITFINRLSASDPNQQLPILPTLYTGHEPKLTMTKRFGEKTIVLRLWQAHAKFTDNKNTLWLGTLDYLSPRYQQIWHPVEYRKLKRSMTPPIDLIESDLQGFTWKKVYYPMMNKLPKKISKKKWRLGVILVRPRG